MCKGRKATASWMFTMASPIEVILQCYAGGSLLDCPSVLKSSRIIVRSGFPMMTLRLHPCHRSLVACCVVCGLAVFVVSIPRDGCLHVGYRVLL